MYLEDAIILQINAIATCFAQIQKIILFGSRVRGDHHPTSDIDLAIYASDDFSSFIYRLETEVSTLLTFDITDMRVIDDVLFKKEVEEKGVLIYEKSRL